MGKRLVRAKDKIRQAGIPFSVPERGELPGRLGAVLDAIYAAFTEGWTDAGGADVARSDLTGGAMLLARLVTDLLPEEPEAPRLRDRHRPRERRGRPPLPATAPVGAGALIALEGISSRP